MYRPGEVCVSNLNVETRSIAPDEVKRGGKLIQVREPRTISLVSDVLIICISLLAVQVSRKVRCDGILLTEPVDGINSENVVSSTNLCTSQAALRSSMRTINDRGPSRDPWGIPPLSVFQEETS